MDYEMIGHAAVNILIILCVIGVLGMSDLFFQWLFDSSIQGKTLVTRALYRTTALASGSIIYIVISILSTGHYSQ